MEANGRFTAPKLEPDLALAGQLQSLNTPFGKDSFEAQSGHGKPLGICSIAQLLNSTFLRFDILKSALLPEPLQQSCVQIIRLYRLGHKIIHTHCQATLTVFVERICSHRDNG